MNDWELLQGYTRQGSQAAFTELVTRHLPLVYAAARRQAGSAAVAQDIAQQVFLELARNAAKLHGATPLPSWLHVVTRRRANDAVRAEARRRDREHAAYELAAANDAPSPWAQVEPLLDEALAGLNEQERGAVLLRYFENKPLRDVGGAYGISEDAAQKRVSRAIEQLRQFFTRRGLVVTAAGFVAELSAHAVETPPAGLVGVIARSVAASGIAPAVGGLASRALSVNSLREIVVTVGLVAVVGFVAYETTAIHRQRGELARLEEDYAEQSRRAARLTRERDTARARLATIPSAAPRESAASSAGAAMAKFIADLRKLIAARPDQQIPELQLIEDSDYFRIAGGGFKLDNENNTRLALAALREYAKQRFWRELRNALPAYLRASGGMLPAEVRQLAPYFSRPLDPAILARYEMLQQGRLLDVPVGKLILEEVVPIDRDHDSVIYFRRAEEADGLTSGDLSVMAIKVRLANAQRAFWKANPGTPLTDIRQALPYFEKPPGPANETMMQDPDEIVRQWQRYGWPLPNP